MSWYAVKVLTRKELEICKALDEAELRDRLHVLDTYCPIETYSIRLKMKRHPIVRARALTPGYIFVNCRFPLMLRNQEALRGVLDIQRQAGSFAPAGICESALMEIKIREAEIAARVFRRKDRSKRSIRQGSPVKVGDRLAIPHLGIDVPNQPVDRVEGNYAETVAPNGMRIRMPLVDIGAV